ncbi:hypothetical protein LCGC14_2844320, partial [marine sediment metagenome]
MKWSMKAAGFALAAMGIVVSCEIAMAETQPLSFEGAKWIWYSPGTGGNLNSLPAGVNYFRAEMTLPDNTQGNSAQVKSAEVIVTCDNLFALHLNGLGVGECPVSNDAWGSPKRYDVTKLLVPGRNVVAVEAVNTLPGPAALIVKLVAHLADGQTVTLISDETWKGYV